MHHERGYLDLLEIFGEVDFRECLAAKVQLFNQLVCVSGVGVHLVAGNGLCGASMSTAVMSDHAVSPLEKEHHLSVSVVCRERPAMVEKQRLPSAPVLVINLSAVFRRERWHSMTSLTCRNWAALCKDRT